jgi:hypothetical protein
MAPREFDALLVLIVHNARTAFPSATGANIASLVEKTQQKDTSG